MLALNGSFKYKLGVTKEMWILSNDGEHSGGNLDVFEHLEFNICTG